MFNNFFVFYRRFFSIEEIEEDTRIQRLFYFLLIGFFASFVYWIDDQTITKEAILRGEHVCLPYFQNCEKFYFLSSHGFLTTRFWYAILSGFLFLSLSFALKKKWSLAHFFMLPATLWKFSYLFILSNVPGTDFNYFHLPVLFIFLFSKNKLAFSRLILVVVYSTSAAVKFDNSWIVGSYFSSIKGGLPLFPTAWIPFLTNGVILFEIFSPWMLLFTSEKKKNIVLVLWFVFHIYSISIVGFKYPLQCMAVLVPLFLDIEKIPKGQLIFKKHLRSYFFIIGMYALFFLNFLIPGDTNYNLKNMKLGVRMFVANHQCYSEISPSEHGEKIIFSNNSSMIRCQPYPFWFQAKKLCRGESSEVGWKFYSAVNGGPFYELVNQKNICTSTYKIFFKNKWFIEPSEGAKVVGYPKKNYFFGKIKKTKEDLIFLTPQFSEGFFEKKIKNYLFEMKFFYWALWLGINFFGLYQFIKQEHEEKKLP